MEAEASNVPVAGVAMTGIGVAVIRARESERDDRLYDDPLAHAFVAAAREGFTADRWQQLTTLADQFYAGRAVAVRLFDDRVRQAVEAGIRQIVLLGAGLDTRAFRMALPPEVVVFEIDLRETFAFKEAVLDREGAISTCRRQVVVGDLRADWRTPLLHNGFRADMPTYWVDEGTLGYLTQDWNQRVVVTLTELSAPGSRFGVSKFCSDPDSSQNRELRRLVAGDAALRNPTPSRHSVDVGFDVDRWLGELGWDTEFHSWNDTVVALGRTDAVSDPRAGNIAAVRR